MNINKETLLIWNKFNKYRFYEKEHYYTYDGKRVTTSVTQLIKNYHPDFDSDKWAEHVAWKENKTKEEILKSWDDKRDISSYAGTLFHLRAEQLAAGKVIDIDYSIVKDEAIKEAVKQKLEKLIPLQDAFFDEIRDKLIPIKTEFTVGLETAVAGNIDLLVWNEEEQELQICDYKTNKALNYKNAFSKMFYPFSDLDDCNYYHYCVQLNIYKYIIQKVTNVKIGNCYLFYFNENNEHYEKIKCVNLQQEVEMMLTDCINKSKEIINERKF